MDAALALTLILLVGELLFIISSVVLMSPGGNVLGTCTHAVGTAATLWYMLDPWTCYDQWYILIFGSLPAVVHDVISFISLSRRRGRD